MLPLSTCTRLFTVISAVPENETGHVERFEHVNKGSSLKEVVTEVLKEFLYVIQLQAKFPERFFTFYEFDFNAETLENLTKFLKVEKEQQWFETVLENIKPKKFYQHEPEMLAFYKAEVDKYFSEIEILFLDS